MSARTKIPVIAITADHDPAGNTILKQSLVSALCRAHAIPLILPTTEPFNRFTTLFSRHLIHGVLIPGGGDHPPSYYGQKNRHSEDIRPKRSRFEKALIEYCLKQGLPILGICGGMQLLNIVSGGDLYQDLDKEYENPAPHRGTTLRHNVKIVSGSRLHRMIDVKRIRVNSTHHQAVRRLGKHLHATACASDGVIEAIEHDRHPFYIGVQWHPERLADDRVIRAFVKYCERSATAG